MLIWSVRPFESAPRDFLEWIAYMWAESDENEEMWRGRVQAAFTSKKNLRLSEIYFCQSVINVDPRRKRGYVVPLHHNGMIQLSSVAFLFFYTGNRTWVKVIKTVFDRRKRFQGAQPSAIWPKSFSVLDVSAWKPG